MKNYNTLYNALYSVYSWPNVVLPLFGGFLSDKFGVRLTTVIFSLLILIGQIIFAVGLTLTDEDASWGVMLAGRVVFGFGGESLSVAMSAMIAQWFSGKELALALGVNLALARLGSVVNDLASLKIAQTQPIYWATWVGAFICVASLLATITVFFIDRRSVDVLKKNRAILKEEGATPRVFASTQHVGFAASADGAHVTSETDHFFPSVNGHNHHHHHDVDKRLAAGGAADSRRPSVASSRSSIEDDVDKEGLQEEHIELSSILKFPMTFWMLTLSCLTVYCAVLPFNNIASKFIKEKFSVDNTTANELMLVTYLTAGCLAPFLGAAIDKVGRRGLFNLLAASLIVTVHIVFGAVKEADEENANSTGLAIGMLVLLGICYSIYASALWPSIAMVVPDEYAATAYGLVTAVQNLGLAAVPLAIGALQDHFSTSTGHGKTPAAGSDDDGGFYTTDWTPISFTFAGIGGVGILCGIMLNIADARAPHPILNESAAAAAARKTEEPSVSAPLLGSEEA